jgi:hypothetical protein
MRRDQNRTVLYVIGGLVLLLVIAGVVGGSVGKQSAQPANPGARVVVVPTADRARAVVVPPCATGVPVTPRDAASAASMVGSLRLSLPQGPGVRLVLVPRCATNRGSVASADATLPSAAFVLPPHMRAPPIQSSGSTGKSSFTSGARTQLIVPSGSQISTVVVPPCTKAGGTGSGRAIVFSTAGQSSDTAVARAC